MTRSWRFDMLGGVTEHERDAEEVRGVVADSSIRGGAAIGVTSDVGAVAAGALRLQRVAGNRATVQWLQRSGRLLQRAPLSWHQQRVAEIHAALEGDQPSWEGADPPGAYRVFNGLSNEDQIRVFRGLSSADRKKLEDNLDQTTGDRARMYQAIQEAKAQAADLVAGKWWTDRANEVHSAIRLGKFVEYPEGAFWILNPHNEEARRRIIGTFLDAYHLDDLLDHETEAIAAGVPNAKSICDEARAARAKRKTPRQSKPSVKLVIGGKTFAVRALSFSVVPQGKLLSGGKEIAWGAATLDGMTLAAGVPVLAMTGGTLSGLGGAAGAGAAGASTAATVTDVAWVSAEAIKDAWQIQQTVIAARGALAVAPTAARVVVASVEIAEGAAAAETAVSTTAAILTVGIVVIFVLGLSLAAYQAVNSPDGWWKLWEPYSQEVAARLGEHGGASWPGGRPPSGASPGEPQQAPGSPVPAPAQDPNSPAPALAPGQAGAQPVQAPGAAATDPAQAPGVRNDPLVVAGPVPTPTSPSLLQIALAHGAAEELGTREMEVFAYGTTADAARAISENGRFGTAQGNFGGKIFAAPSMLAARVFAARRVTNVKGSSPGVVGFALPRTVANMLRQRRLLELGQMTDPPPGLEKSRGQWEFAPSAIDTVNTHGFFFLIE